MIAEIINLRKFIVPIAVIALTGIAVLATCDYNKATELFFHDMIRTDNFSVAFSVLLIVISILLISLSTDFYQKEKEKISDYVSIMIFTLCGAIAMASFSNMTMFFIGLEVMSISLYLLAGSNKRDIRSNEAAMKYFLMGSFASGILLMGITLVYGASGSFNLAQIASYASSGQVDAIFYVGLVLILIALLFKVSAVPFHFWAPDVYEGSPMLTTAFMSTLGKVASFAAFYRLFSVCFSSSYGQLAWVFSGIIAATILVGNLSALRQDSFKRMLAFSGVTNAGFMLLAISSIYVKTDSSLFYYAMSYSVSSIAAFGIAISVSKQTGSEKIDSFRGLGKRHPFSAVLLTMAMLSLSGIPPFSGFFAKYFIFSEAIRAGHIWLTLFAVINSIISVYYYLKVVFVMFSDGEETASYKPQFIYIAISVIAVAITIIAGLMFNWFSLV